MKSLFRFVVLIICISSLFLFADAKQAEEINAFAATTDVERINQFEALFDGDLLSSIFVPEDGTITFRDERGIGSAYFMFDLEPLGYSVTDLDADVTYTFGQNGFLHEYLNLEEAFGYVPKTIRFSFDCGSVHPCELRLFTSGEPPKDVQIWKKPTPGKIDLLLFSTHGDDEQLFFSGILPYYAGELGYEVEVAYFTSHRPDVSHRVHEMLNGLYGCGVRNYPVFGPFPDFYSLNKDKSYNLYAKVGITKEQMLSYVVEQLRKFKPIVAVGHDVNGEYGHGAHRMYSELLREGVELAADAGKFEGSAQLWGVWDTPKTYLHLYEQNPIVMDWDKPLEAFDGMTAYEVSRDYGFRAHASQFKDYWWYYDGHPTAASVDVYGPCQFGLYRSLVGLDVQKNDFFENRISYTAELREAQRVAELVRLEMEREAQLLEEERLQAEEIAVQEVAEAPLQARSSGMVITVAAIIFMAASIIAFAVIGKRF